MNPFRLLLLHAVALGAVGAATGGAIGQTAPDSPPAEAPAGEQAGEATPKTDPAAEQPTGPVTDPASEPPAEPAGEPATVPPPETPTDPPAPLPTTIEPEKWLVAPRIGAYRRGPLHVDAIEAAIATGDWSPPSAGDSIRADEGAEAAWREENGRRSVDLAGGYAFAEFDSPATGVMLLEAPGVAAVCLNGEWLPGDPYGVGTLRPPAVVREGKNWLLAHLANPAATPRLVRPDAPVTLLAEQATVPDLVARSSQSDAPAQPAVVLSVPIANATNRPIESAKLRVTVEGVDPLTTPLRRIEALLVTPLTITAPLPTEPLTAGDAVAITVEALSADGETLATTVLSVAVVDAAAARTCTFVSRIDASVQPYRALPPADGEADAAVLVLHDAGQTPADALAPYAPHPEAWLVAPGGRGPWAFDWEDWSRVDALEALDDFLARREQAGQPIDEDRVSLTGLGMGGHGALRLATLRPDRFVSAGFIDPWISFTTQGRAAVATQAAPPVVRALDREQQAGDPREVIENLAGLGVSLLWAGESGVGVYESRLLRERLGEFHRDFAYREIAGESDGGDWRTRQINDLVARRRVDYDALDTIQFATPDVGASASLGWVTILSARDQGETARVRIERDLARDEVTGTTENAGRLRLSLEAFERSRSVTVRLDSGRPLTLRPGREGRVYALARGRDGAWRRVPDVSRQGSRFARLFKDPGRAGGLKSAFYQEPLLVYGTGGTEPAKQWAVAKARYDAHQFFYRGAGRLEVAPDTLLVDTLRRSTADADRSVVLYGAADTNTAWALLRQEDFVRRSRVLRIEQGEAWLGDRPESDDRLAVLAVRPRVGSRTACVATIGGTGPVGMRLTTRLRYFWSGVDYPDYLLFGPGALEPFDLDSDRDVRAAGYFDSDWGVDSGQVLWRDVAL